MNGLIVLISIVAMASTASSRRCYDCGSDLTRTQKALRSRSDLDCLTSENNYGQVVTCARGQDACYKVTATLNGTTVNLRGCAAKDAQISGQCREVEFDGIKAVGCNCFDKDLCNDAPRAIKVSFRALLMVLAFPLMTLALI